MAAGAPILEMREIRFSAQNEVILSSFSHCFAEGITTAIVGSSGSGKSTALKLAAGLLVPSSGVVYYRGMNVARMNRAQNLAFRRESAVVFQDSALWANQNLDQILELPLMVHFPAMTRDERLCRIRAVVAEVGYHRRLDIRPARLSMGEQKLIAFARAMLCRPGLLFLDEWTESLDDEAARHLIGIVRTYQAAGKTIIFVSHDARVIKDLADVVVMIRDGQSARTLTGTQIASSGEVETILGAPEAPR